MSAVRRSIGALGELLITGGVLLLLFVAWQLWWTDVAANASQRDAVATMERTFTRAGATPARAGKPAAGQPFAIIRIPRLGADYASPVYQGTDRDVLQKGIGHYVTTALPGVKGNFAVAGHRMTYGGPFRDMERLRKGDAVVVETATAYYVYVLGTSFITDPHHVQALDPMPERPGVAPDGAYITLTACHPKYASTYRMIVHGKLTATYPHAKGLPASYGLHLGSTGGMS